MTANPRRVAGQIHVTQPARKSQPPRKSQQEEEQQQPQAEAPVQNLHLAALKTAPAMQSQVGVLSVGSRQLSVGDTTCLQGAAQGGTNTSHDAFSAAAGFPCSSAGHHGGAHGPGAGGRAGGHAAHGAHHG